MSAQEKSIPKRSFEKQNSRVELSKSLEERQTG